MKLTEIVPLFTIWRLGSRRTLPLASAEMLSRFDKPQFGDLVAGISVALVLIPQSLAYAELAGMPPYVGLYCSALPVIVFSFFASSPYLQTGPVAVTSLLTISALPEGVEPQDLPLLGGLMALIVGIVRIALAALKLGAIVRLMAPPVITGFVSGSALVICSSQFPKAFGMPATGNSMIGRVATVAQSPDMWSFTAIALSIFTAVLFVGGRRISPLFPGVLLAVVLGVVISQVGQYEGPKAGPIPNGLPPVTFDLPWDALGTVMVGSLVIAVIGFAEPASIAMMYANETGQRWNSNQGLFAAGIASVAAAFTGGYPVGGSFSRSSINKLAGATTRWAGCITGLTVTAFLPFASLLNPLPTAVLGAIVLSAVGPMIKPKRLIKIWKRSRSQALLAWATFGSVVFFAPRLERAVFVGVALSAVIHFVDKFRLETTKTGDAQIQITPKGLMWLASEKTVSKQIMAAATAQTDTATAQRGNRVTVDLAHIPFLSAKTVDVLCEVGCDQRVEHLDWINPPPGSERQLAGLRSAIS